MKRVILLFAVTSALLSCRKETEPMFDFNRDTFVCNFEQLSKVDIEEDGGVLWREGDFIVVSNGTEDVVFNESGDISAGGGVQVFKLSSSDIVDGGRGALIAVTLDKPLENWYAVALHDISILSGITSGGKVSIRSFAGSKSIPHVAVAKAAKDASSIMFRNMLELISFKTESPFAKVTFEAVNGSANGFCCGAEIDAGNLSIALTDNPGSVFVTSSTGGDSPNYVPLFGSQVLDKGIVIKLYENEADSQPFRKITTGKAFPVQRNAIVSLGNIEGVNNKFTSYKAIWDAGLDIVAGGVIYNKATYQGNVWTVPGDRTSISDEGGIYFVEPGTSEPVKVYNLKNNVIIGNKIGEKSFINIQEESQNRKWGDEFLLLKNLDITCPGLFNNFKADREYNAGDIVVDDCSIRSTKSYLIADYTATGTGSFNSLRIVNSRILSTSNYAHLFDATKCRDFKTVDIRNNIFYTQSNTALDTETGYLFRNARFGELNVTHNTFVNISGYIINDTNIYSNLTQDNIPAPTVKNNLAYFNGKSSQAGFITCSSVYGYNAKQNYFYSTSPDSNFWSVGAALGTTNYVKCTFLDESPFSSMDFSTGTFVKTSSAAAYGATGTLPGSEEDVIGPLPEDKGSVGVEAYDYNSYDPSHAKWATYQSVTVDRMGASPVGRDETNRYGSLVNGPTFRTSGFYKTIKYKGRWVIVDPVGKLHIEAGVNSITPGDGPTNRESFTQKYGDNRGLWINETVTALAKYGFNGAGAWSDYASIIQYNSTHPGCQWSYTPEMNLMVDYAATRGITINNSNVIPVFDPQFQEYCSGIVPSFISQYRDDPNVLGYFSDNELPFRMGLLDKYLEQSSQDYGRKAAENWLESKGISSGSITDAIRKEFAGYVAETYFRIVSGIIKAADPNHMYLGARLAGVSKTYEPIYKASAKYCDIVSVNYYGNWAVTDTEIQNWQTWADKPFIITEFYTKGEDSGLENTSGDGWIVHTQNDRGIHYENFTIKLLRSKACVGWHWFKYLDNDPGNQYAEASNRNSNKGIYSNTYTIYQDLADRMYNVNTVRYDILSQAWRYVN